MERAQKAQGRNGAAAHKPTHNKAKARTGVGATAEEEDRKEEMEEKEREEDAATVWPGTLVEASRPELEGLFHR